MRKEEFYEKMLEDENVNSPPKTEIDVDKIVDTISLKLENKLNEKLSEIQKTNENLFKKENEKNGDIKDEQGVNKEGTVQSDNVAEHEAN